MAVIAYVSTSYTYDPSLPMTRRINDRVVVLTATSNTFYHTDPADLDVHVVDFVVDRDDNTNTVEVWIHGYDPPFRPDQRRMRQLTMASPYKFSFDVPTIMEPDFKWGVNDPDPFSQPTPGYKLRVNVKRK